MRSDVPEMDSDAMRLRCVRSVIEIDVGALQLVSAFLDRVEAQKPRKRGPRGERSRTAAEKEATT
jgi:hypothetical protein